MANLLLILFFERPLNPAAQQQCSLYVCKWLTDYRIPSSTSGGAMAKLLLPCGGLKCLSPYHPPGVFIDSQVEYTVVVV